MDKLNTTVVLRNISLLFIIGSILKNTFFERYFSKPLQVSTFKSLTKWCDLSDNTSFLPKNCHILTSLPFDHQIQLLAFSQRTLKETQFLSFTTVTAYVTWRREYNQADLSFGIWVMDQVDVTVSAFISTFALSRYQLSY